MHAILREVKKPEHEETREPNNCSGCTASNGVLSPVLELVHGL